jgi:4-diphosphocytidyl-2-C-methyl-D-erythritol kinase
MSNAKINLFFAIEGIRQDNFCEVTTIIAPIAFADRMNFSLEKNISPEDSQIKIFQHTPLEFSENDNTITRAIELFRAGTNIKNFSLRIDISKGIPLGSGFGGGSGNGIFTLKALNQLYDSPLSEENLISTAQKMGTDCPFFVKNCPQLAYGRGDILSPTPPDFRRNLMDYFVLIFCPPFTISTIEAYEKVKKKIFIAQNIQTIVGKIFSESRFESLLYNTFQGQLLDEHAELGGLFDNLRREGYFPCVTGSGSGCFILHRERDALEKARQIIVENFPQVPLCEITRFL